MENPSLRKSKKRRETREVGETSGGGVAGSTRWNYFRDDAARESYEERYVERRVLTGRPVNIRQLSEFPIIEWFNVQGWTGLLEKDFVVYPNLVRMFYANLKVKNVNNKGVLDCFMKGVRFTLTEKVIEEILGIQSSAARPRRPITPTMAKIEILGEHAGTDAKHASYLDIPTRLLMLIVDWSIRPTSGHFTRLTEVTAMIMHNVKYGNHANLGKIMMSHMANVANHVTANLPYGMWLTPIFEHFGVDLSYEIKQKVSVKSYIGENSIVSMGYEKRYPRGWRKKQAQGDSDEEREEEDEMQREEPEQDDEPDREEPVDPTMRTSSGSEYLSYMARFDMLEDQMRSTREEVRASREAQESFYAEMRTSQNNFYSEVRENQNNFHNEMRESHHAYYTSMGDRWSSINDNMAGMSQFIQGYMASHPADFPPPPPPSED